MGEKEVNRWEDLWCVELGRWTDQGKKGGRTNHSGRKGNKTREKEDRGVG